MDPIILPRISDQKPLVSVVSITYNHEPYIRDCLDGFLMQKTDFPVEIIIHDDASTDHTADIIREYHEKRPDLFHVIIEQKNIQSQGRSSMTETMMKTKGKYIAICEGDDYWTDPLKLQKQFDLLESHKEYIGVVHRYRVISKDGLLQDIKTFGYYDENSCGIYSIREYEKTGRLPSHINTLMFRKLQNLLDLFTGELYKNKITLDTKLFLILLIYGNIYRTNEFMSVYRYVREINGNSWTSRNLNMDPFEILDNYKDLERVIKNNVTTIDLSIKRESLAIVIIKYSLRHFTWSNLRKMVVYFWLEKKAIAWIIKYIFRNKLSWKKS